MSLGRNTAVIGSMTLLSRILGFVRDVVLARVFGAGLAMDAFFVAFKIPNFLRRLFAEGAFSLAFVPVLSEYRTQRSHAEVQALVSRVSGTLAGVLLAVTVVGVVASPVLVMVFAPGFLDEPDRFSLTAAMLRITFPYILFISLVAFAGGILNSYGRFWAPAFAPVLLNLCFIAAALWLAPVLEQPVTALALAVFVGGVVQLAFMLPGLLGLRLLVRPRWGWRDSGVRRILKLMGPAVFGSSVAQINLLIDTLIASFLVTGSVSWLYYSDRMMEFPLGVFGIALSTAILPSLSASYARGDQAECSATMDRALRWVLILGLPAALGLIVLAGPILATLFQYDAFTAHDTRMATLSLMAYGLGLPAFIAIKVLAPGFYARQDTRTPVRIAVTAMLANMVLNVVFVVPMVQLGMAGPHAGLALATSAAAWLNAGLLYRRLRGEGLYRPAPGWGRLVLRVSVALALLAAVALYGAGNLDDWLAMDGAARITRLGLWIAAAAAVYLAALPFLGQPLPALWRGGRRAE